MQTVACAVFPAEASPMPPAIFHIRCTRPVEGPISWALLASVATLHDRQIRRLRALKDAAGIDADLPMRIRRVGSIADKPANFSEVAV